MTRCPSHSPLLLLLSLLALPCLVLAEIYHVKPPNSTLLCPDPDDNHCKTLEEYAAKSPENDAGMTFLFLAGEHPLSRDFSLSNYNMWSVSLISHEDSGVVNINCSGNGKFVLKHTGRVIINNLTMLGCHGNQIVDATNFTLDNAYIKGISRDHHRQETIVNAHTRFDPCNEPTSHVFSVSANRIQITRTNFEYIFRHFYTVVCVYSHSHITIENTTFQNNAAASLLHVHESIFKISNSHFLQNNVSTLMHIYGGSGTMAECDFTSTRSKKGVVFVTEKSDVRIYRSNFSNNSFINSDALSVLCAAIHIRDSTVDINGSVFTHNSAKSGCIYAENSELHVHSSQFLSNTATYGGAFTIRQTQVYINHHSDSCEGMVEFINNSAEYGGAMNIIESSVATIHCARFTNNSATGTKDSRGGAILARTNTKVSLVDTEFCGNFGGNGGVLFAQFATLNTSGNLSMHDNNGSIYLIYCTADFGGNLFFINNHQPLLAHYSAVTFTGNSSFTNNYVSPRAIISIRSELNIHHDGVLTAQGNQGEKGGAMHLVQSELNVYGQCNFLNNHAFKNGGAIHAYETVIRFKGIANFQNNSATVHGGAIFMDGSAIRHFSGRLSFTENHAEQGGAIFLQSGSRLHIVKHTMECKDSHWYCVSDREKWQALNFNHNSADRGGALYVNDVGANSCSSTTIVDKDYFNSECFVQTIAAYKSASDWKISTANFANINFTNNSANVSGAVLYGGLLDRCTLDEFAEFRQIEGHTIKALAYFQKISGTTDFSNNDIVSDPMRVCWCDEDDRVNCSMAMTNHSVVPGKLFNNLRFAVVDQTGTLFNNSSYAIIASLSSESSRLREDESKQMLQGNCCKLNFTLYSNNSVNLTLYAKESPCTEGISKLVIPLDLSACPVGFSLSNTSLGCECDPKLNDFVTNCNIQNNSAQRQGNTWITFPRGNDSNISGILVHDYCPYDYCRPPSENAEIWLNLSDPNSSDTQCAFNRSGLLCGCCQDGYSLTLGGSECRQCTNTWMVFIFPFALAGIALVLVMMVCNLTLATGTINGPLFYANILIANRFVFFPQHKLSIPLQVFVSMLGLNLGITTCFYDGLDGLGKIFMQIAFEVYLIILVVLVVLMGRSVRVSNFFHKYNLHPLHTLATLIVLSYEKLSRKIFSLFAFTSLRYVYNDTATNPIWLFDTCEGSHIWQQVILYFIGVIIIAAGLALNFILLFNKCIVGKCRSVYFNTFMTAFNAPFKPNHQYWVGLLLLIRNISYIVCETFNAGKNPTDSLHFIFTLIVGLLLLKFFYAGVPSLKISLASLKKLILLHEKPAYEPLANPVEERSGIVYKNPYVDYLETSFLVNLSLLTYFTLSFREDVVKNQNNQAILFSISSAVVLITVIGILVYHTWVYTGISRLCHRLCRSMGSVLLKLILDLLEKFVANVL